MENDCLFCKIAGGETDTEFLYQNETLVVFKDIHPQAPVHLLIVPRKHIRSVNDLTDADRGIIAELMMTAQKTTDAIIHNYAQLVKMVQNAVLKKEILNAINYAPQDLNAII